MKSFLRSVWREPRAPGNPGIVWWDRWLVGAVVVAAIVETVVRSYVVRSELVLAPVALVIAAGLSLTLLWRRVHPLGMVTIAFIAITTMNVVAIARGEPSFGLYTMAFILLLPYALLRWGSGREIVLGMGLILVAYITGIAADYTTAGEAVAGLLFGLSPALIGTTVRYRNQARVRDREKSVLTEREHLARELHDTVAHHVSAIAIQAQAGQALAATDPSAPLVALGVIEHEASKTLAEMRAMVSALRQGQEADTTPMPGVSDIADLGRDLGDGPQVVVDITGPLDDLGPAVDAALYRVAQESVTNALRHARRAESISVTIVDEGTHVRMAVADDGDSATAHAAGDPGFGLVGMAERAKLLGGSFKAGPGSGRGWVVQIDLPKDGASR